MMRRYAVQCSGAIGSIVAANRMLNGKVLDETEFPFAVQDVQNSLFWASRTLLNVLCPSPALMKARVLDPAMDEIDGTMKNWSNTHACKVENIFKPSTVVQVEQIVKEMAEKGKKVRVVGSGLSPNGIGFSNSNLISLENMNRILKVDKSTKQITVEAGALVGQVLDELKEHGLTLQNLASINQQQIGGFIQVGAHGTGARLPPVDEQVVSLEVVSPGLGKMTLSKKKHPEWFSFVKLGLGCFGIVTKVTLQCIDAHHLEEDTVVMTREQVRKDHIARLQSNRHVRYMWIPYTDSCVVVTSNEETNGSLLDGPDESTRAHRERIIPLVDLLKKTNPDLESDKLEEKTRRMGFGELRDWLLRSGEGCLSTDHVKQVNIAEEKFWKRSEFKGHIDESDHILGFDCGGQQLVLEVGLSAGTQEKPNGKDLDFIDHLLQAIEEQDLPAPAPIEQRWSCGSSAAMSSACPQEGVLPEENLCSWVGIIMYLPEEDPKVRKQIIDRFESYKFLLEQVEKDNGFDLRTHWAKIEVPTKESEVKQLQEKLARQYPLAKFEAIRKQFDPTGIFCNTMIDVLLRGKCIPAERKENPEKFNI